MPSAQGLGLVMLNIKTKAKSYIYSTISFISQISATKIGKEFERKIGHIFDETPTAYDKYIDKIYNNSGIGSYAHRIFDGSHSPIAMWEKVKETLPDDNRTEEIKNYFLSMVKDLQTPMGIPFKNLDKGNFDKVNEILHNNFLIPKSWLADAVTLNLTEIIVSSLGVFGIVFGWNKRDKKEFADLVSTLATVGVISGNPFLFIFSIISLAKGFTKSKINKNLSEFKKGSFLGLIGALALITSTTLFASPLMGLLFGLIISISIKRQLNKFSMEEVISWVKKIIIKLLKDIFNFYKKENNKNNLQIELIKKLANPLK